MKVYVVTKAIYKNSKLVDKKCCAVFQDLEFAKNHVKKCFTEKDYTRLSELNMNSGDWGDIKAMYEQFYRSGRYDTITITEHALY